MLLGVCEPVARTLALFWWVIRLHDACWRGHVIRLFLDAFGPILLRLSIPSVSFLAIHCTSKMFLSQHKTLLLAFMAFSFVLRGFCPLEIRLDFYIKEWTVARLSFYLIRVFLSLRQHITRCPTTIHRSSTRHITCWANDPLMNNNMNLLAKKHEFHHFTMNTNLWCLVLSKSLNFIFERYKIRLN